MPTHKIIAYFMHEKEEALCSSLIPNAQVTQSYYVGEVNDQQLKQLQDQKIIVQILGSGQQANIERVSLRRAGRIKGYTNIQTRDLDNILEEERVAGYPAYYKLSIEGVLLEEYRNQFHNAGIDIIEFIPPDQYLVRVNTKKDYLTLSGFLFIRKMEFYNSMDTGVNVVQKSAPIPEPETIEKRIMRFDIYLHRPEDLPEVLQWLSEKKIDVAGAAGRKIRIYLLEDSSVMDEISQQVAVQSFDEYVPPKLHNDIVRQILGLDSFSPPVNSNMQYTGEGQIVGVADTGIDDTHPDFQNQMHKPPVARGRVNDHSDFEGHGTHVAGSIVGNGSASNGTIRGMAPGAKLFFQSIMDSAGDLQLPIQLETLFQEAYDNGVRIHNNSWGSSTSSRYTVNAIEVDEFVARNRDMLLVFSAGNEGNAFNPLNAPPGYPDFLSIGSPGSAKNILTVGASRSTRAAGGYAGYTYGAIWPNHFPNPPLSAELISGDVNALAGFSSRGPCDDNRIKPDVVAPGTDIASVRSSTASLSNFWGLLPSNNRYAIMGGTSMSAPIVSGCAAVVREYYQKIENHSASAALLKATIVNGCKKLTGADCLIKFPDLPNYNQGFGMVDMSQTIPDSTKKFKLIFYDNYQDSGRQFRNTGQRIRLQIKLTVNSWLRICMAYTDIPGRALQNNLNLMLDYNPDNSKWTGNENVPTVLKMPDATNNIEVIQIVQALAGDYTMQITATNIIRGPQDFAYVITCGDVDMTFTSQ